jgi:hypothetical protein
MKPEDIHILEDIKKDVKTQTASFAIWEYGYNTKEYKTTWSNANNQLEFFKNRIKCLKPNIIFLALNPSKEIQAFQNFHWSDNNRSRGQLKKFMTIMEDKEKECDFSNLNGAYMTDIVKNCFCRSSNKVITKLKNDKELQRKCKEDIEHERDKLAQPRYILILLGKQTKKAFDLVFKKDEGWYKTIPIGHYSRNSYENFSNDLRTANQSVENKIDWLNGC